MKGLHHIHLRKRKAHHLEPFPARKPLLRLLDRIVLAVGIIGPVTSLPQAIKIYTLHNATGVSTMAWFLPALLDIPWIIYGLVHRDRAIVISYSLWFSINITVTVGALLYGAGLF